MSRLHGFPRWAGHFFTSAPPYFGLLVTRLLGSYASKKFFLLTDPRKSDPPILLTFLSYIKYIEIVVFHNIPLQKAELTNRNSSKRPPLYGRSFDFMVFNSIYQKKSDEPNAEYLVKM